MSDAPRVGVGCIVVHEGRLLLVQSRHRGLWSTPGGNLDFGESPVAAAARETLEETGVPVRDIRFIGITNDVMDDRGRHYVTIWMRAEAEHDRISVSDTREISDAGWYDFAGIPAPRQPYFDRLLAGGSMPEVDFHSLVFAAP